MERIIFKSGLEVGPIRVQVRLSVKNGYTLVNIEVWDLIRRMSEAI